MSRLFAKRTLMNSFAVAPQTVRMFTRLNRCAMPVSIFMPNLQMRCFSGVDKKQLFVENIHPVDENDFRAFFEAVPNVFRVNFFTPTHIEGITRAWVQFNNEETSEEFMKTLEDNTVEIGGQKLDINFFTPRQKLTEQTTPTLYARNLNFEATDEDLHAAFSSFGPLVYARVIKNQYDGRSRGFGFVRFEDYNHANQAQTEMNGQDMMGREIYVDKSLPRKRTPPKREQQSFFNESRDDFW